jgi:hypothetical protein
MKRAILLLAVLALTVPTVIAQHHEGGRTMRFDINGSVVTLGNPLAGPFSTLATLSGHGKHGKISGQGLYLYKQIGSQGEMVCDAGQSSVLFEASGDTLLLTMTPGPTGTMVPTGNGTFSWTQTWTGVIAGGTGRFDGATGTFKKVLNGFLVMPGLVSPWSGTLEVHLDGD